MTYFIKLRQWDGERWTQWVYAYCTRTMYLALLNKQPKFQFRVIHQSQGTN